MAVSFENPRSNPPYPPFSKGGNIISPFEKGGLRGIFIIHYVPTASGLHFS